MIKDLNWKSMVYNSKDSGIVYYAKRKQDLATMIFSCSSVMFDIGVEGLPIHSQISLDYCDVPVL